MNVIFCVYNTKHYKHYFNNPLIVEVIFKAKM